jgi:predicted alpha/beta-hydrolase family hydrolase
MRLYGDARTRGPAIVLGHGAGAGHDHPWMRRAAQGLATRGVAAVTFNFPYIEARRRAPDPGPRLEEAFQAVWEEAVRAIAAATLFAGGKSMGGRIASQAAAAGRFAPAPAGLVFFGYPLHPPGKPQQRRDAHLGAIDCPLLFLSGTRDPFGSPDELQELTRDHDRWQLELVEGGDHSLAVSRKDDRDGRSLERALDLVAAWMQNVSSGRG